MKRPKKKMTVNDLPKGTQMGDVRIKTPEGIVGWWVSQWQKGVWIRKERSDTRVHPVFVDDLKECLNWEVVQITGK